MDTSRLPIRIRLALWYLASFFVVLALFGAGMFYAMQAGIQEDFDRDLKIRLAGIESFLDDQSQHKLERVWHELEEHAALRPGGELLQISDEQGQWIFQSQSMRHLQIGMPAYLPAKRPVFATVSFKGVPVRLITGFKVVGAKRFSIQLGQSLEESSELVEHFGWILIAAIPIVLLVACATGYWMARRSLQPVFAITQDARAIGALDISKRIAVPPANDELRDLSTTLNEMMDRLEAAFHRITQFTADASHELRTPIALIRTTAELAIAEGSARASMEALLSILEESERTTRLLEDLLVLARADSNVRLRLESVDLTVPARQVISQTKVLASSKGLSLDFVDSERRYIINGNAELLRRLVLILTENAVKYTPVGGRLLIRIYDREDNTCLEVNDTGIGISSEDLPHIFERFFRADKARDRSGGAGLGLSIAEWIVRLHGASIDVTSVADRGTTFTVRFPKVRTKLTADFSPIAHSAASSR
jgi:heavy metal sensor kinase